MDYLDPKKKQAHKIRIMIGYGLFSIAIAMATLLLVYIANGYYVDRDTGAVIQNGLVFIDSRPGGADIYINGEKQRGTTDARLVIPGSKEYEIEIKKNGYRDWGRSLILEGGSLRRLTYARLIPEDLTTTQGPSLRSQPVSASQSIDKKWLVLSHKDSPLTMSIIDLEQSTISSANLVIPSSLVSDDETGSIEVVEWAGGDNQFLAKYVTGDKTEYLLVDRENPADSININSIIGSTNFTIGLRDRSNNQFFAYNENTKMLYTASVSDGLSSEPFIERTIEDYTTFGSDWVLYMTSSGEEGLTQARFKRGAKDIEIKNLKTDKSYLLQLAKLGNAPVMAISSPTENRAVVYNDPENYLNKNPEARIPVATTVLLADDIQDLIISSDSSVVFAYGSSNFASHEFEADRSYNFKIDTPIDSGQEPRWLDGQHLSFSSDKVQQVIDFDGSNQYALVESIPSLGSFYSDSIDLMFSFTPLIPETDTSAAVPARLTITNKLTPENR